MPSARRWIWSAAGLLVAAVCGFELGTRAATPPEAPAERVDACVAAMRTAVERYRSDHGWYPCDPERDYNRDGREDLLRLQLTGFTRDDGKPANERDGEFHFGPYLADIPADPLAGSRRIAIDQVRVRTLANLAADVAADNGAGGWYYEARTGFVVPNHGRGRAPRLAGVR